MDLKIKDVAELLNTSEGTIENWIQKEEIPFYRIDDNYLFSRLEIEDWVLKQKDGASSYSHEKQPKMGATQFSLYRAIHNGAVLHKVSGTTKEEVLCNVMDLVATDLKLDANVLTDLLLDRERLQATGLGGGIGLPHTRDSFTNAVHDRVVVAFPETPIEDYGALDNEPVHTLFFLFARNDKQHLHLLAKIAHLSGDSKAKEKLLSKPSKAILLEFLRVWEGQIPKREK